MHTMHAWSGAEGVWMQQGWLEANCSTCCGQACQQLKAVQGVDPRDDCTDGFSDMSACSPSGHGAQICCTVKGLTPVMMGAVPLMVA